MLASDLDRIIETLHKGELITESEIKSLCQTGIELCSKEDNVLALQPPITICGDLHGQFWDLLEIFRIGDLPPYTNYLFMGDFVDRGYNSVETFLLLLALKVRYPSRVALIRGNHECRHVSQIYGFYDECFRKFGTVNVWNYCIEVFDTLALSAVVGGKFFAVHGGISPALQTVGSIANLDRRLEVPVEGPMCDLLWSDPDDIEDWAISTRGAGYTFGEEPVKKWNHTNNFSMIIRAHQLINEGYRFMFNERLVTVWSCPNYCYRCGNVASILELDENLKPEYKIFTEAPSKVRVPAREDPVSYFL